MKCFSLKKPRKYIYDGYSYTSDGKKAINESIVTFFYNKNMIFPKYYFHLGWSEEYNYATEGRVYTTLNDYVEVNNILWTETIHNNRSEFMHNFVRNTERITPSKVMIFEIDNDEYLKNSENFKIWNYDEIKVKNKNWIPEPTNLIVPDSYSIPDKISVYSRINALKPDFDCSVFYKEGLELSKLKPYGIIYCTDTDDEEITIEEIPSLYHSKYLKYKKKYLTLKNKF